jgi:hypothetical protein
MLLSEIVYNIKNLMAGGIESDDENLSSSQVAFMVGYYRARLLRQDRLKGRMNRELYIQNLGKVPLITADKNECCDIDACILRTELQIPKPLETYDSINLTFIGTVDGRPFSKTTHNAAYWSGAAKYTGKAPKWYYQNGYIYIINPPTQMLSHVNIQGVFEDPTVAMSFRTCDCDNGETCIDEDSFDFEYPMPMHYVDLIVKMVAETEMRILTALPTDISNDSLDQVAVLNAQASKR